MKKVLLTGASGFIGRHTIQPLLDRCFEVHAISRRAVPGVYHHPLDLFDVQRTSQLMAELRPSHLLHFAWYAVPGKYWTAPENLDWVKISLHLMQQFAQAGGRRMVVAGSCAEYDWTGYKETVYGTCKAALQQIFQSYTHQIGLSSAWGRIFYLFGPHEYPDRLAPNIILSMLKGQVARCSHGNQIRDFMYVQDVADAFAALLDSDVQGAVDIASGQPLTLKEFIGHIATTLNGQAQYGAIASKASEPARIVGDASRLCNEVKWQPKCTWDLGLDKTIAWWSQQEL